MRNLHKPLDIMIVTQPFAKNWVRKGAYSFQLCNTKDLHTGADLRARTPLPVYAGDDSTVIGEGGHKDWRGGLFVSLCTRRNDEGFIIYNGHLSKILVKKYDKVKKGQIIGYTGRSGNVAPHLHHSIMPITYTGDGFWDYVATNDGNGLCGKVDPMTFYNDDTPVVDPVENRYGRRDTWFANLDFAPHFLWLIKQRDIWKKVNNQRSFNALKWGNWSLREVLDKDMEEVWSQKTKSQYLKELGKL